MSLESLKQRKWVLERIVNNFENHSEVGNKSWFSVDHEIKSPSADMQRELINKVFRVMKAIEITDIRFSKYEKNSTEKPEENWFEIKIKPKFIKLCKEYGIEFGQKPNPAQLRNSLENESMELPTKENDYGHQAISKKNGNFFCGENMISFGENTQYKDLFDIIYSNCVQNNFVSYEKIDEELRKLEWEEVSKKKRNKRIQNATTNGIFRFAKIENKKFQNINPLNGRKLIKMIRRKGIEFNNYR